MSEPKSLRKEARAKILMILLFSEDVFGLVEEVMVLESLFFEKSHLFLVKISVFNYTPESRLLQLLINYCEYPYFR